MYSHDYRMQPTMKRRSFINASLAGIVFSPLAMNLAAASQASNRQIKGFGPISPDKRNNISLPSDFDYQIVSLHGQTMSDGLKVPGWPDSMHVFNGPGDNLDILCNHELSTQQQSLAGWQQPDSTLLKQAYDPASGKVAPGGVRHIRYNPKNRKVVSQNMVLAGTLRNCSGGSTPWGSWLSCEESVAGIGTDGLEQDHGYCFEVPAAQTSLASIEPLKQMGRFNHEAAVVDPTTGIVYLSEDRGDSLFYRYLPKTPGKLAEGGTLQALAIRDSKRAISTGNLTGAHFPTQQALACRWITLEDVDSADDSLRKQGQSKGAAVFIRGEGLIVEKTGQGNVIWLMCTSGGQKRLGQIFQYRPSPHEGSAHEKDNPGRLVLFSEPNNPELMNHGDNITMMPNGDLLICEDNKGPQRLLGMTAKGEYYVIAANPRNASEFTGACFSPDGSTLFVNMQQQGGTLAIRGPWQQRLTTPI